MSLSVAKQAKKIHPGVGRILDELQRAGAYRNLREFLRSNGVPVKRSWLEIRDSVLGAVAEDKLEVDLLTDFFRAVRCSARKSFSLYRLEPATISKLRAAANRLHPSTSWPGFPFPLAQSSLARASKKPTYAGRIDFDEGTAFVFCSQRVYLEKEVIPRSAMKNAEEFKNSTITAERERHFQAYDVVFIPRDDDELLQIRIDAVHARANRIEEFREAVQSEFAALTGSPATLFSPMDVFPAIPSLYDDPSAGRVVDLSHDCDTRTSRRETTRSSTIDMREEDYHTGGKAAVSKIDPFRISVSIPLSSDRSVVLTLPGTLRMLNRKLPLRFFEIEKPCTSAEVEEIVHAVASHAE